MEGAEGFAVNAKELTLEQVKACKSQELYEFFEHHDLVVKPYFDYDEDLYEHVEPTDFPELERKAYEKCEQAIFKVIPDAEIYYCSRSRNYDEEHDKYSKGKRAKISLRFTIANKKIAIWYLKHLVKSAEIFDNGVYGETNQKYGAPTFEKEGKPARIVRGSLEDCLIQHLTGNETLIEPTVEKKVVQEKKKEQKKKKTTVKKKGNLILTNNPVDKALIKRFEDIIYELKPSRAEERDSWLKFLWALFNEFESDDEDVLDLWLKFSRKCPEKYDRDECIHKFYDEFNRDWKNSAEKVTIKTLNHWLEQDRDPVLNWDGFDDTDGESSVNDEPCNKPFCITADDMKHGADCVMGVIQKSMFQQCRYSDGKWYVFEKNSGLWKVYDNIEFIIAKQITKGLNAELNRLNSLQQRHSSEDVIKSIKEFTVWYQKKDKMIGMLQRFAKVCLCDETFHAKLDRNEAYWAFQNGMLDLKTRKFRHGLQYEDFLTRTILQMCHHWRKENVDDILRTKIDMIMMWKNHIFFRRRKNEDDFLKNTLKLDRLKSN